MGIETAVLAMQVAGAGMGAASAYSQSAGAKAAYGAQSQIAANNAQIARWQAEDATRRGAVAVSDQGIRTAQLKGKQRAALAANGVDLGVGSAVQILSDTDYFGQVDRDRITDNAAREAWGYRTQGANFMSDSSLLRSRADAESPLMAAGTSLLTSATKVAGSYYSRGGVPAGTRGSFAGVDYQQRGDY